MRLHSLRITAFGPFAGSVDVDFDALSDAGLFLLSGDNGAGKTSILDAVCFALYGAVPGDRQQAKQLRCDRAAPDLTPEVVLELTLTGRRFRIVRSPGWVRPKKRGSGLTTQQPAVSVSERRDGAWVTLATRLDEAGDLLGALLGLTLDQFCQVVLLPQGRFEAFLRAGSPERQRLLQQVFRLGRFERVEEWLREHRRTLGRESLRHRQTVSEVVHRISEVSGGAAPESWDAEPLGTLLDWEADLRSQARLTRTRCAAGARTSAELLERAAEALGEGRRVLAAQARHAEAEGALVALQEATPDIDDARERLARARRAAPLAPLVESHARAADDLRAAVDQSAARRAEVGLDDDLRAAELAGLADAARSAREQGRALVALEGRLAATRSELADVEQQEADAVADLTTACAALGELPEQIATARQAQAEAEAAAHRLPQLQLDLDATLARRSARQETVALSAQLTEAQALAQAAVQEAQDLRQLWLDLREARLTGFAAELAAELAVGADCPVCGSAEHPRPAMSAIGVPSEQDEREARARSETAEAVRHAHEQQVRDLETSLGMAEQRAGDLTLDELDTELAGLTDAHSVTAALADALDVRRSALEALLERERGAQVAHADARVTQTSAHSRAESIRKQVESLAAEHLAGFAALGFDGSDPDDHRRVLDERASAVLAAAEAAAVLTAAEGVEAAAAERLARAAADAGFADAMAVVQALLDDPECEELERSLVEHDHQRVALEAVLADPEVREAAGRPAPDIPALTAAHAQASVTARSTAAAASAAAATAERLEDLAQDLVDALAVWAPVRNAHVLADRVASFADGSSPDNPLKLKLAGYVVAFRLSQVVAAANERLRAVEPRFTLEHTGRRGAGETRGGLSLVVRDDWSGETRDPATLSGGETFVVSLSLALGLADVIAHEAGGSELETLFVDEGFGSLDPTTLDRVMDTLDSLREGRRVVGVVSHVTEMRDRIPAQLRLDKDAVRQGRPRAVTLTVGS